MTPLVLDAGALIALERRDVRMLALADELVSQRIVGHVPAGVVAQVWRGSPRQHAVVRLLRTEAVRVDQLSEETAYRLGVLLAAAGTADVTDAHVALLARQMRARVVTSDPGDIVTLDSNVSVIEV